MDQTNGVLQSLKTGKSVHGIWHLLPGANLSRLLANAGYDFVVVDCEHGNLDDRAMHESVAAIASLHVSPIVRVPDAQAWMLKRALDAGAHGVLVPLIRSRADAEAVVQACKFPPLGARGFGSPFPMQTFSPTLTAADYLEQSNESLITAVQIETQEALNDVFSIADVPGIDILFVGPYDLGNSIGRPVKDGKMHAELEAAITRVLEAATAAGKVAGIFCSSGAEALKFQHLGFRMINVTTDVACLLSHSKQELEVVTNRRETQRRSTPTNAGPYGS